MREPILNAYFNDLPEEALRGVLDWPVRPCLGQRDRQQALPKTGGKARRRAAVHVFCQKVQEKYSEGTLCRLLTVESPTTRTAAAFALGLLGSQRCNSHLARCLHDADETVAETAIDALWSLWFRGENSQHSDELYRILRIRDRGKSLIALEDLIHRAPGYAEAFNQRAMVYFRMELYELAAADCETTLGLNPYHYGAQTGLGQCYLRLRRHRAALRAFRLALRINPRLDGIADTVKALENTLGEDGR